MYKDPFGVFIPSPILADVGIDPYGRSVLRVDVGIGPYDGAENTSMLFCTNSDKIRTRLAVVIISQPILFPLFHFLLTTCRF